MNKPDQALKDITSAELTACYRSDYPAISGDTLSKKLTSEAGFKKSYDFIKEQNYPLAPRKISVRAGYFLQRTNMLLATDEYDTCISFASGFSLLSYYSAIATPNIHYIDTDLPHILKARNERISTLRSELDASTLKRIETIALDLEIAAKNSLHLSDLFPHAKRPVFLLEGVSYFLTPACVQWLLAEICRYGHSALIADYWPDNALEVSTYFAKMFPQLDDFIPEKARTLWGTQDKKCLSGCFAYMEDRSIQDVEGELVQGTDEKALLLNPNEFFPIWVLCAHH
jgi:O-methyltransferase involved in polyketide biosynthesis